MWVRLSIILSMATAAIAATSIPLTQKPRRGEIKEKAVDKKYFNRGMSNYNELAYFGTLAMSNPSQIFSVLYNTGSGDLWLPTPQCKGACQKRGKYHHERSRSYTAVGKNVTITYGIGSVEGFTSRDEIFLGDITIPNQTFVEATSISNVYDENEGYDGVFGLAFQSTAFSKATPVFEHAVQLGVVHPMFGLYLAKGDDFSFITFGGVDPNHFKGQISYVNLTQTRYWELQLDLKIKGKSICAKGCHVKSDSGDSLMSGKISEQINKMLGGRYFREGFYSFDCSKVSALPPVTFNIGGMDFSFTSENYVLRNVISGVCLSSFRQFDVEYVDINLGIPFLKAFYTVYDVNLKRVGFALLKK